MGTARHEHQIAGRQGDVGGETGALGAQRIFHHLHHDVLPLAHQLGDVAGLELLFLLHRHALGVRHYVGGVQEGRLVHADIDESRLHAGQYPADLAFVDVAHDAALGLTLHVHFLQQTVLDQGDPGFGGVTFTSSSTDISYLAFLVLNSGSQTGTSPVSNAVRNSRCMSPTYALPVMASNSDRLAASGSRNRHSATRQRLDYRDCSR